MPSSSAAVAPRATRMAGAQRERRDHDGGESPRLPESARGGAEVHGKPAHAGQDTSSRCFAAGLGLRIHYKSYGKGAEALVLIHGWSCNLDNWRDQIPDLAKRTRVIALDLPGHGQSDQPELTYSMDLFARAVEAVLRAEGVQRVVLVGHSMGTPVARQFYRKYPDKTRGIVIVDGPLQPFGDKQMLEGFLASLRGPGYQDVGAGMLTAMFGPSPSEEMKERVRTSFLNTPQHVLVSAMEGMADDAIWGPDPIKVPVLAILAKSPAYPADIEQRDRLVAPKLELQMWEGVGHFLMMEQPKQQSGFPSPSCPQRLRRTHRHRPPCRNP